MQLHDWITAQPRGAITRLHTRTGIAYATLHKSYRGKRVRYATAVRISTATGGAVSIAELCEPSPIAALGDLRRRARGDEGQPPKAAIRKRKAARKRRNKRSASSSRSLAGAAHAAA
jgi:hypothetical protein